jgi:ATP-binding cassette, subfamily F, member 3
VLIPYYGNYTDYRTRKRPIVLDIPEPAKPGTNGKGAANTAAKVGAAPTRTSQKKTAKVKVRSVEDVERDIEKAEERVKTLEAALSEAALKADAAQLTQLSTEYDQAKAHVDELLAEWERLLEAETAS